jgi:hypothetical protein
LQNLAFWEEVPILRERYHFLGERTELLFVTESPPPPSHKSLCSLHRGWCHERLTYLKGSVLQ